MAATVIARRCGLILLATAVATADARDAHDLPPTAYRVAAQRAGVPSIVLYAVALQESGMTRRGRHRPWPWTLNVDGAPQRHTTRAEACASLQEALRSVRPTRVDVGLGQINYGFHRQRVDHPCELLDPYRNLRIASQILRELHTPGDDWLIAVGRYHRRAGGEPAARYRRLVQAHVARLLGTQPPVSSPRTPKP
jgi:soluble lytic murein transglycosylase-like protein